MTFQDYSREAHKTAIYNPGDNPAYSALGLAGEAGEVANKVKKFYRDRYPLESEKVVDELGDVLWYINELAIFLQVPLGWIAERNLQKLKLRQQREMIKGEGDTR